MVKSIEELKDIITDGMNLIAPGGERTEIRRFPNNIIKLYNKSVSWAALQDLLANGEYTLEINEEQTTLPGIPQEPKKIWGGKRVAGPGKKLGRPPKKYFDKRRVKTFRLLDDDSLHLKWLAEYNGISQGEMITRLIREEWEEYGQEIADTWPEVDAGEPFKPWPVDQMPKPK